MSMRTWAQQRLPSAVHPMLRTVERRSAAMIGGVLRRVPGTSKDFGPPRAVGMYLRDYADAYREIYGSHLLRRRHPFRLEDWLHPSFEVELVRAMVPAGVGVIPDGRVFTGMGAVIAPPDTLLFADVSHTAGSRNPAEHPIFRKIWLPPVSRIDETVAVLTSFPCCISGHFYYGHWMLDTLPRLHLLRASGFSWDKIVAPLGTKYQRETLDFAGVDAGKIISDPDLHIEAARLVVPTLPGIVGNPPTWVVDFLRENFLPLAKPSPWGNRLYISRALAGSRHVNDEKALVESLRMRGFKSVLLECLPFAEQVSALAGAEVVVAPHTTGLTNIAFCTPGSSVVEIFSPRYVTCCWYALAETTELRYGYVIGDGSGEGPERVHENITINPRRVHDMLDLMGF